jgi:ubiquinone/menaquinone biosynthesis C-methylase UbiE
MSPDLSPSHVWCHWEIGLLSDYANQAETYDRTRGASPSILEPVRRALADGPGRSLVDVGGGTGNYAAALAEEGWEPLVIDRSPAMLAVAAAKGLQTLEAPAESLPLGDATFDAVTVVSVLHHLDDPQAALAQVARILRRDGCLALVAFTREDIQDLWLIDYFPASLPWMEVTHPPVAEIQALLPGSVREEVRFDDLRDASLAALASYPNLILDPEWRRQTSYFERMARDHPGELSEGLDRLRADVESGRAPDRPGRASVIAWQKA